MSTKPRSNGNSGNNHFNRRVVLCGSMGFYRIMDEIGRQLQDNQVPCIIPENEDFEKKHYSTEQFEAYKREVSFRYLKKIRNPETFGILVINIDKHGISNYIGPNTFAEIAIAYAQSKKIYLFQDIPEVYEDELKAWGAISLKHSINRLITDFLSTKHLEEAQLELF